MRRFWVTATVVFILDQALKYAVVQALNLRERGEIEVFPPYLVLRMGWNYGINFGLLAHEADWARWALITLALAICAWVVWWMRRERGNWKALVAGGLLVGGALGNVIDRVIYGAVADFLSMTCCGIENPYVFNLADIAIFIGAFGLVFFAGAAPGDRKPARSRR